MTEVTDSPIAAKVRKFPCASCGADVRWDPGASAMKCPYCGATREVPKTAEAIMERPVEGALREPRDLGWGTARKTIHCNRCGATSTLDPGISSGTCAFCGTTAVVEAPPDAKMIRPEGLLPFAVERNASTQKFREWMAGLWFRPNDLKSKSSVTTLRGVYVPFWTFDAATDSYWTAMAGYHYYVSVQVVENGQTVTRQEQRTRWEPASGTLELFFDDVPVPASRGLDHSMTRGIEPFPTANLIPYEPSYLSGFIAEEYAVTLEEALSTAKARMQAEINAACSREVPGDEQRDLEVRSSYSGVAYKSGLLPIWIAAYEYGGKPYRFLVNGVTGKVSGEAPFSWIKITLLILAIIIVVIIFASLKRH